VCWLWPPATAMMATQVIMFCYSRPSVFPLLSAFLFRRRISEVAWPIFTKLPHVGWWPRFIILGQKGRAFFPKWVSQFRLNFGKLCNLITNISRTQVNVSRKAALQFANYDHFRTCILERTSQIAYLTQTSTSLSGHHYWLLRMVVINKTRKDKCGQT